MEGKGDHYLDHHQSRFRDNTIGRCQSQSSSSLHFRKALMIHLFALAWWELNEPFAWPPWRLSRWISPPNSNTELSWEQVSGSLQWVYYWWVLRALLWHTQCSLCRRQFSLFSFIEQYKPRQLSATTKNPGLQVNIERAVSLTDVGTLVHQYTVSKVLTSEMKRRLWRCQEFHECYETGRE